MGLQTSNLVGHLVDWKNKQHVFSTYSCVYDSKEFVVLNKIIHSVTARGSNWFLKISIL